jgi:septum formation protein
MPNIILASQSKYRAEQLKDYGLSFTQVKPLVDEDELKTKFLSLSPADLCQRLAKEKALSVAKLNPDSIVIGSDQLVEFNGKILGKPGTIENNIKQLQMLSGQAHNILTAVHVYYNGKDSFEMINATLTLRDLTFDEIKSYVAFENAIDCAGGYKIESRGISLMKTIDTADFTSIKGLPLLALTNCFKALKVNPFGLCNSSANKD